MRLFLVLLAVLSLAVRWADAGCGCAAHNGLATLAEGHATCPDGHDHDLPPGPAFDHGCDGESERAVYATGARVQPEVGVAVVPAAAVLAVSLPAALAGPVEGLSPSGPPSRAVLKVYRI